MSNISHDEDHRAHDRGENQSLRSPSSPINYHHMNHPSNLNEEEDMNGTMAPYSPTTSKRWPSRTARRRFNNSKQQQHSNHHGNMVLLKAEQQPVGQEQQNSDVSHPSTPQQTMYMHRYNSSPSLLYVPPPLMRPDQTPSYYLHYSYPNHTQTHSQHQQHQHHHRHHHQQQQQHSTPSHLEWPEYQQEDHSHTKDPVMNIRCQQTSKDVDNSNITAITHTNHGSSSCNKTDKPHDFPRNMLLLKSISLSAASSASQGSGSSIGQRAADAVMKFRAMKRKMQEEERQRQEQEENQHTQDHGCRKTQLQMKQQKQQQQEQEQQRREPKEQDERNRNDCDSHSDKSWMQRKPPSLGSLVSPNNIHSRSHLTKTPSLPTITETLSPNGTKGSIHSRSSSRSRRSSYISGSHISNHQSQPENNNNTHHNSQENGNGLEFQNAGLNTSVKSSFTQGDGSGSIDHTNSNDCTSPIQSPSWSPHFWQQDRFQISNSHSSSQSLNSSINNSNHSLRSINSTNHNGGSAIQGNPQQSNNSGRDQKSASPSLNHETIIPQPGSIPNILMSSWTPTRRSGTPPRCPRTPPSPLVAPFLPALNNISCDNENSNRNSDNNASVKSQSEINHKKTRHAQGRSTPRRNSSGTKMALIQSPAISHATTTTTASSTASSSSRNHDSFCPPEIVSVKSASSGLLSTPSPLAAVTIMSTSSSISVSAQSFKNNNNNNNNLERNNDNSHNNRTSGSVSTARSTITTPNGNNLSFVYPPILPSTFACSHATLQRQSTTGSPVTIVSCSKSFSGSQHQRVQEQEQAREPCHDEPPPVTAPMSYIERRQFRTVVPVRVFLESSDYFVPEHDSFDVMLPDQERLYAHMFAKATSRRSPVVKVLL